MVEFFLTHVGSEFVPPAWQKHLRQTVGSGAQILLANVGEEAVGFVTLLKDFGVTDVDLLWVAPRWRGQGIGTALVRECERRFGDRLDWGRFTNQGAALFRSLGRDVGPGSAADIEDSFFLQEMALRRSSTEMASVTRAADGTLVPNAQRAIPQDHVIDFGWTKLSQPREYSGGLHTWWMDRSNIGQSRVVLYRGFGDQAQHIGHAIIDYPDQRPVIIDLLFVDPKFRRQGYGTLLVNDVETRFGPLGRHTSALSDGVKFLRAIGKHKQLFGYEQASRRSSTPFTY